MAFFELEILDRIVELPEETRIGLTFQRNTLGELNKRQANTSNQFKLPKSQLNKIITEHSDDLNSSTDIPYLKLPAKIRQGGIEVMPNAVASLESVDKFYNLIVNSGITSLFDLIGEKRLSDLDLSASDHIWNIANVKDFTRSDWRYLLIDWGWEWNSMSGLNVADGHELVPIMFAKYLVEKICSELGYTVTGSLTTSQQWPRLTYTPDNFTRTTEWKELRRNRVEIATDWFFSTSDAPLDGSFITTTRNILNTGVDTDMLGGPTGVIYTAPETIHGTLEASYTIEQTTISPSPTFMSFDILRLSDSAVMATTGNVAGALYGTGGIGIALSTGAITLPAGEQYQFRVTMTYNRISPGITPQVKIYKNGSCRFEPYPEIIYGTSIDMASLYKTKQKDFLKEILKIYCVNADVNEVTKVLTLNFFDDVRANIPRAIDWSQKIDKKKQPVLSFVYGNYAQKNNFKWKEHDTVTKGYGDFYMLVDNEKLEVESDQLEMLASATESVARLAGHQAPKISGIQYSTRTWKQPNNRFLLLDTQNFAGGIKYNNAGVYHSTVTTDLPFAYFKKAGATDNLGFDDSLVENHYGTVIAILDHVKFYKIYMILSAIDIQQLDFDIPIHLDIHVGEFKANGDFYLNRVADWTGKNSCLVELLRL